jgi:hypothetical protein
MHRLKAEHPELCDERELADWTPAYLAGCNSDLLEATYKTFVPLGNQTADFD